MQKNSNKILQSIIHISKCTHKGKIESLTKVALKKHTQFIQKKFNCTTDEAVFFAILFSNTTFDVETEPPLILDIMSM